MSILATCLTTFALLLQSANAQFPGYGGNGGSNPFGGNGPFGGGSNNGGDSGSGGSSNGGSSTGGNGGNGISQLQSLGQYLSSNNQIAHGVLASLAFVIFFPFGAISVRLLPGKFALYAHIAFQVLSYVLFVAAFGIGVYMARNVNFPGFSLMHQAHPIIGIIVFAFVSLQPVLGIVHHVFFKKYSKRTVWSYAHLVVGRIFITLGIINGGLGLRLAGNASKGQEAAYGVVAGVVWLVWIAAAVYGELKRVRTSSAKESHSPPPYHEAVASDTTAKENGEGPSYYA